MKKYISILIIVITVLGCKSKKTATDGAVTIDTESAKKIIDKHYENKLDFKTLYIKASAKYSDVKQNQNISAEIKIKKDEQILVSVRFLGITMAKALITPSTVSYYEKIKGTYYEGDYTALSKMLGTELDYKKVENLLVGQALADLKKGKYKESIVDQLFRLEDVKESDFKQYYFFDAEKYLLKKEEITQISKNVTVQVDYNDHKKFDQGFFPTSIDIQGGEANKKTKIDLNYNTISFNEVLSFPYSIPDGYKKVIIK